MYEEVVDAKAEVTVEIEDLKARIEELKEDGLWSKREIKKWKLMIKLCFVCLCLTVIVITIVMLMAKTNQKKFVLGY